MMRQGNQVVLAWPVQVADERVLCALTFDALGGVVEVSPCPIPKMQATPASSAAEALVAQLGWKARRIGSLAEALARAQLAARVLEDLVALEQLHGAEAAALLAPAPGGPAP